MFVPGFAFTRFRFLSHTLLHPSSLLFSSCPRVSFLLHQRLLRPSAVPPSASLSCLSCRSSDQPNHPRGEKSSWCLSKRTLTSRRTIGVSVGRQHRLSFDAFEHNSAFTARYRGSGCLFLPRITLVQVGVECRIENQRSVARVKLWTDQEDPIRSGFPMFVSLSLSHTHAHIYILFPFLPLNRYPRLDFQERSTIAKP